MGVTGVCVLSHSPASTCPNFLTEQRSGDASVEVGLRGDWKTRALSPGNELGVQQVESLMARRYTTLVGLLGETSTGKTCLLSSLYLLASCGEMKASVLFGGSATILGFEQRLRQLRLWDGAGLPEQIVEHTNLSDPRRPGFVHVAFRATKPDRIHDIVFSDLPGEWTTGLMKRAAIAARFAFLRRADALVLAITAPSLLDQTSRHNQLQNARVLIQRLRDTVEIDLRVPLIFAITRCDVSGPSLPGAAYELAAAARGFGFTNTFQFPIAAFSDRDDVPSGFGVGDLLDAVIGTGTQTMPVKAEDDLTTARMFARYQGMREACRPTA